MTTALGYTPLSAVPDTYATKQYVGDAVSTKQDTLVSGSNIKSVNSTSLIGSGNLEVGDVRGNGIVGLWTGTQAQYDAITAKSNTTLYLIHE